MKKIDGVIKDWGDRTDYGRVKGRKGKNIVGGRYEKPAPTKRPAGRERLAATVRKHPEVMVKITRGRKDPITGIHNVPGKDLRSIKAHFDYISRNGDVELEDEQGRVHRGKEDVRNVLDDWRGGGIPYENGNRREAFNIVLSMPPGTDRPSVKNAARAFAADMFRNHQYVFASHEDEKHPHVHLSVKALSNDGIRLNPRKADLQHWRELFVEKLREQGVEANATPRKIRGIVRKAERQGVRHINKGHADGKRKAPARVTATQIEAATQEARGGQMHQNPAQGNIITQRKQVQHDFGAVARALAAGDQEDKKLAVEVVQFVKQMPPLITRHEQYVQEALRRPSRTGGNVEQDQQRAKIIEAGRSDGREDDLSR